MMIIMAVALYALPTMAQQQEWQSTSTMPGAGNYTAPVTAVGATSAASAATTTESYSPAKAPGGPRRLPGDLSNPGDQSGESPVGDAVLPLLLMSLAFGAYIAIKRRKQTAKN